nr:MAG TPA: hypothetical protein [Caudoviricetes sp.]
MIHHINKIPSDKSDKCPRFNILDSDCYIM